MKTLFKSFLIVGISCFALMTQSCGQEVQAEVGHEQSINAEFVEMNMSIEGMTCEIGCAKTIEHKLNKANGIEKANVDFKNKSAVIRYDKNSTSETEILAMVNNDTYTATVLATADMKECKEDCKKACCAKADKKECKEDCKKACCSKDAKKCSKDAKACAKDGKKCSKDSKTCSKDAKKCSTDKKCSKSKAECSKKAETKEM
jgi:copper chaperone CopZ